MILIMSLKYVLINEKKIKATVKVGITSKKIKVCFTP